MKAIITKNGEEIGVIEKVSLVSLLEDGRQEVKAIVVAERDGLSAHFDNIEEAVEALEYRYRVDTSNKFTSK